MYDVELLTRCDTCGVPQKECLERGMYGKTLDQNHEWDWLWVCRPCYEATCIHCSHCDEVIEQDDPRPKLLDDGSYLCKECDKKLVKELDDFITN